MDRLVMVGTSKGLFLLDAANHLAGPFHEGTSVPSVAFPGGGVYVMRDKGNHVFIDCGPIGLAVPSRDQQHRSIQPLAAQPFKHTQPRQPGQSDVENDDIESPRQGGAQRAGTIRGGNHVKPFGFQPPPERGAYPSFIIDDQHP